MSTARLQLFAGLVGVLTLMAYFLSGRPSPRVWGFVSSLLLLTGHSTLRSDDSRAIALRLAGLALAFLFVLGEISSTPTVRSRRRVSSRLEAERLSQSPPFRQLRWVTFIGGILYGLASIMDAFAVLTIFTALTFICVTLLLAMVYRSGRASEFTDGWMNATYASIILCLLLYLFRPSEAMVGGRLQGYFVSANTLGFFCAAWILHAFVTRQITPRLFMASTLPVIALLLTGNRSGGVALVVAMVTFLIRSLATRNGKQAWRLTVLVGAFAVGIALQGRALTESILRDNNSRLNGIDFALHQSELHWLGGVGYNQSPVELASTPLRWLVEEGYLAAALCVLAYAATLLVGLRSGPGPTATAAFGIVSSLLEGWYFAGGSALFFCYWLVVLAARDTSQDTLHLAATNSSADSGHGRPRRRDERYRRDLPRSGRPPTRVGGTARESSTLLRKR